MPKKKKKWNLRTKITQALRRTWFYSPDRNAVTKRCRVKGKGFKCEGCHLIVDKIAIDHIEPVVNTKDGFIDWNTYIDQLFVDETKQQGLCKDCHSAKSRVEQELRKIGKAKNTD